MNAHFFLSFGLTLFLIVVAYRLGRMTGARRERTRIVTFFSRSSFVLRIGEPGPMVGTLTDPAQAAALASFLDHEGDAPWLRARFGKPRGL